MTESISEPHFIHDCRECTSLGQYEDEHQKYDLYHCTRCAVSSTVIARYGSAPSQYIAGIGFARNQRVASLVVALRRAIDLDLESRDETDEVIEVTRKQEEQFAIARRTKYGKRGPYRRKVR